MSAKTKAESARRIAGAAIETLSGQLDHARSRAEAGRRTAAAAKAEFKRARKNFKAARKSAKELRKQAKNLKRELAKATLASSLVAASRVKKASASGAKKKVIAVRRVTRKPAIAEISSLPAGGAHGGASVTALENSGVPTDAPASAAPPPPAAS